MVSNILNTVSDDVNVVYPIIAGLIGSGLAVEFRSWCNLHKDLPDMEDIFDGRETKLPERFENADGPCMVNCVLFDIDEKTGKTVSVERFDIR